MTWKPALSRETSMSQCEETFRRFADYSPDVLSRIDCETMSSERCVENVKFQK